MPSRARVVGVALLLVACTGTRDHVGATTLTAGYGAYDATGLATWYGDEVAGNRTASGDRFDPEGVTVAHRTLPLGSFVEITALDTGRTVIARVNDRGPGRKDRLIDLSHGAARLLGTDRRPVATVRVRTILPSALQMAAWRAGRLHDASAGIIRLSSDDGRIARFPSVLPPDGRYVLQIATFSNAARAAALADRVGGTVVPAGNLWHVRMGPYDGAKAAERGRDAVAARGYGDVQILPADRTAF